MTLLNKWAGKKKMCIGQRSRRDKNQKVNTDWFEMLSFLGLTFFDGFLLFLLYKRYKRICLSTIKLNFIVLN